VFGPGSIAQAHTVDEWIDLSEVATAASILTATVRLPEEAGCSSV